MSNPVDVIILSWDRARDTIAAIESVLAQRSLELLVFVVDQGSRPDQLKELKAFCAGRDRVVLVCNAKNSGVAAGRNQATALGNAEFVAALDNDAEFSDEQTLARAVAHMEGDTSLAALAVRIVCYEGGKDDPSSWSYPEPMEQYGGRAFETSRFVGAGYMLRRSAFEAVGRYDERLFFLHEELDLGYRLINAGYCIRYVPDVVVRHKVSAERRVHWSYRRSFFDIRNGLYLSAKYRFSRFSGIGQAYRDVARGLREGNRLATLHASLAALPLVPFALYARFSDPNVRIQPAAAKALRALESGRRSDWQPRGRR